VIFNGRRCAKLAKYGKKLKGGLFAINILVVAGNVPPMYNMVLEGRFLRR